MHKLQPRSPTVRHAVAALLVGLAPAAHAMGGQDCAPEDLAPLDAWFVKHPLHAGLGKPATATACKTSPVDQSILLIVAAYDRPAPAEKNLVVAMVDTRTGTVRSAFKGWVDGDAALSLAQGSVSLDTARYDLAPGVRAFAVDQSTSMREGGLARYRTLFVQDGAALRPVLDAFVIYAEGGAADGADLADPTTAWKIAIASHATHGYADLVITPVVEGAAGAKPSHGQRSMLTYDGERYGSPANPFVIHPETVTR
jgi:hypothetical protein